MRKLDLYIARSFLEPFLLALALIVGLYIVGDALNNLDDYLREAEHFREALSRMARIYLFRIPTFLIPILPIAMLIGGAYGVAHLTIANELTAMKASGVSLWRILAPIYVMAVLVALLGAANREALVPRAERYVASDESAWTGETDESEKVTLHVPAEDVYVTMDYNVALRWAKFMSVTPPSTTGHIMAHEAAPVRGGWKMLDVTLDGEKHEEFFWESSLRRRDVEMELLDPQVCRIKMLRRKILKETAGPRRRAYLLYYHERLAYPFTGIALVMLGLPFVIGNPRVQRSRMLGVGVCVLIYMVFYAVQFVTNDLGRTGHLPVALAAWLPSLIFGARGLYLLETVHS